MTSSEWKNRLRALPYAQPPQERGAAVLLLLTEREGSPCLVFEVRSKTLSRQPGEVCLPGGGVEAGETPEQCALRETREELGLTGVELLCHVETRRHSNGQRVEVYAGAVESLEGLNPQPEEVEQVFTVPIDWFLRHPPKTARYVTEPDYQQTSPELHPFLPGYRRESVSPMWVYRDHVIWGFTARVLEHFLAQLQQDALENNHRKDYSQCK